MFVYTYIYKTKTYQILVFIDDFLIFCYRKCFLIHFGGKYMDNSFLRIDNVKFS